MAGHVEVGGAAAAAGDDDVKKEVPQLLSVSWNQNRSCFTAATTADFRVFRCCPFGEHLRRVHEDGGGFTVAEMLFRSNIFATVSSSSSSSSFSSSNNNNNNNNRDHFMVKVWDDITHKCLWQRGFPTAVRSVRVSRERIAVVVDRIVRVYPLFKPTRLVCKVETTHNPRGLCCLSCRSDETTVLACPGTVKGQVRVERLDEDTTRFIDAHSSDVACMEMTLDGTVLATASVKGTLVRVFNTVDGTCLQEVTR
ncbi:hypothetical protein QOZ80_5BG0451710 [Eleusine coracana subsp. coracana]|nr:hypothetical protein QOZ80_5BG0451710 [Eleusine coracana subsp. coracana]